MSEQQHVNDDLFPQAGQLVGQKLPPVPGRDIEEKIEVLRPAIDPKQMDLSEALFGASSVRQGRAEDVLKEALNTQAREQLGPVVLRTDIKTDRAAFQTLPEYRTEYPQVVIEALGDLYVEYNKAFAPLVEANRENATDYRLNVAQDGSPVNHFVQIDMVALPEAFLKIAPSYTREEVREALRGYIFEIENSLAGYQILSKVFSKGNENATFFETKLREGLDALREQHGKPIVLLAVTQGKYDSMMQFEFGKKPGETITAAEVREISGFDGFFGPDEFKEYLRANGGKCDVLLYVRSSDPTAKLKDPNVVVDNPVLGDPALRAIVKENSLTFNIDAPEAAAATRINDTKGYMPIMNMAFPIDKFSALFSPEFAKHLEAQKPWPEFKGERLSREFSSWLLSHGIDSEAVASGQVALRAKPLKGTYGCYGHVRGPLTDRSVRKELRQGLADRGGYVLQPELPTPLIVNATNDQKLTYIDRNFFAMSKDGPIFMGGFRSMMGVQSNEARKGRIHGSSDTYWAEILPKGAS